MHVAGSGGSVRNHSPKIRAVATVVLLASALSCGRLGKKADTGLGAIGAEPLKSGLLVVSGEKTEFRAQALKAADAKAAANLEVLTDSPLQSIEGFGGAFNEKGWVALDALSDKDKADVLKKIFSPGEGLSLTLCRIPIGSSDYAVTRYSEDESPEDFAMANFSIDRDRQDLIPYIRAAQALNPALRFWASAWSPPTWMKTNKAFDSGAMRDEGPVYAAYALYLAKFAQAYREEGIPLLAVAVQNEPYILTAYPSCRWEPAQYLKFVRDHLGPTLTSKEPSTGIMLGTFNQPDNRAHAMAVLNDPKASAFVKVLGLQWDGLPIAAAARVASPGLAVWHTETDCGNHHWEPGFDPDKPQNDFAYAAMTWRKMRDYLQGGASLYSLWNIVLDETGKSIDANRPWPQNSAIVVDRDTKKAIYTPMYYAFAHFSRYLPAGSTVLKVRGVGDSIAFKRPDGSIVVEVLNSQLKARKLTIKVGEAVVMAEIPAGSFGTVIIP